MLPCLDLYLGLSNAENLSATYGAYTLSRRPAILHGNASGILYFSFGPAFDAVRLHCSLLSCLAYLEYEIRPIHGYLSIGS